MLDKFAASGPNAVPKSHYFGLDVIVRWVCAAVEVGWDCKIKHLSGELTCDVRDGVVQKDFNGVAAKDFSPIFEHHPWDEEMKTVWMREAIDCEFDKSLRTSMLDLLLPPWMQALKEVSGIIDD